MKKMYYRFAAFICACGTIAVSCVEENLEPVIPAVDGDSIVFGVRAGFEDSAPDTKTEYSGQDYTTADGKKIERIDWIEDDKIEIYSPQAENPYSETSKSTHYRVTGFSVGDEGAGETGKGSDYAQLANVGDAGLRWNGTQPHDFYAMYPSSEMFRTTEGQLPSTIEAGVKMGLDKETSQNVMVYGIIPTSQQPVVEAVSGGFIAKPDMDYAYMVAKTTVDPTKSNSVKLSFVPIVTAVEIELVNNSGTNISIGEIQLASTEQIYGEFTANLSSSWTNGYPTCNNIKKTLPEGVSTYDIQISTYMKTGESYHPVTLSDGQFLKFTAFLLPGADIQDLIVRVSQMGVGYAAKNLPYANIPKNLKTRIKGLNLPKKEDIIFGGDNWMDQIKDPTVSFKTLSLPGTGGSFTYNANTNFKQQVLTFDDQWTQGIRAFELSSDRPTSASTSLGGERITCNKADVTDGDGNYWTVIRAIRQILNKVSTTVNDEGNPTETAALILTYQPEDNSPNRNVASYAQSLSVMLSGNGTTGQGSTLSSEEVALIIPYTTSLTLEQARGKLILICRPNQRDENDNGTWSSAMNYLATNKVTAINGCGTAKDRWGARGYKVKHASVPFSQSKSGIFSSWSDRTYGTDIKYSDYAFAPDISNDVVTDTDVSTTGSQLGAQERTGREIRGNYIEYYMSENNIFPNNAYSYIIANMGVSKPALYDSSVLNFGFETNIPGTTCWFQEWARVIPESCSTSEYNGTWSDGNSSAQYKIHWFESYTEKLSNVVTTFDMAISGSYPNYIFINSLCGYLASSSTNQSPTWSLVPSVGGAWGGAGGDIGALADLLNPAFYNHILNSGMENKTGPTGIVLMDFVSNKEADGASYALPAAVISNNFKYDNVGGTNPIPPGDGVGGGEGGGGIVPF